MHEAAETAVAPPAPNARSIRAWMEEIVVSTLASAPEFTFAFEIAREHDPSHTGWDTVLMLATETSVEGREMVISTVPVLHHYPPSADQVEEMTMEGIRAIRMQVLETMAREPEEAADGQQP